MRLESEDPGGELGFKDLDPSESRRIRMATSSLACDCFTLSFIRILYIRPWCGKTLSGRLFSTCWSRSRSPVELDLSSAYRYVGKCASTDRQAKPPNSNSRCDDRWALLIRLAVSATREGCQATVASQHGSILAFRSSVAPPNPVVTDRRPQRGDTVVGVCPHPSSFAFRRLPSFRYHSSFSQLHCSQPIIRAMAARPWPWICLHLPPTPQSSRLDPDHEHCKTCCSPQEGQDARNAFGHGTTLDPGPPWMQGLTAGGFRL
nr:hypothetical protein CFP56_21030 [Quercus suber]